MSEQPNGPRRDAGVTLIELIVSVLMVGLLATSISAAIVVTLRSNQASEGRLNVARAEQSVAAWMPADLSSAVTASEDPSATSCGVPECAGVTGSNALLLEWPSHTTAGTTTTVSYIYRREASGDLYELVRVYCDAGTCNKNIVLRSLDGPEDFEPGVTPVSDDVIDVTVPLAAAATEDTEENLDTGSTARRIVVTIDGGGVEDDAGGGVNRVSITAGGTTLGDIKAAKVTGPSFAEARSRCGGPITIIVDDSGSIANSGGTTNTENAVRDFVSALDGTPTTVKIIKFSTEASTLQPDADSNDWDHRFNMSEPADVEFLVGDDYNIGAIRRELEQNGGTNWEDAIYRAFYAPTQAFDGTLVRFDADDNPVTELPNLVVFFTDGIPTFNRMLGPGFRGDYRNGAGVDVDPDLPPLPELRDESVWPEATGRDFDQEGFDRTSFLLNPFRNTDEVRLVGVGVGGISEQDIQSFTDWKLTNGFDPPYDHRYKDGRLERYEDGRWRRWDSTRLKIVPAEKTLGNLIAGGRLHRTQDKPYVTSKIDSDGNWTDVETADMFITSDFSKLPSALSAIALSQCGGTLTMQTDFNGSPAPVDVTYESNGGETVTTSLINRAATFDVTVPGGAGADITVTPQPLGATGYAAQSWSCKTKGAVIAPGETWSLVNPADPGEGIDVRVLANQAMACTLSVVAG
ncbi:hypothetical protein [uncultured Ilumatobacter sp.]|uniref:hypothetical protein n=1 Tax=uncultured Ilumatobacter sp. TaxID=879968 RepID=UPI00374E7EDA